MKAPNFLPLHGSQASTAGASKGKNVWKLTILSTI
jgi:hypothetical protein